MKIIAPAARRSSLGELGAESFDPSSKRAGGQLLTVGFNASAWMYSLVNVFSWRRAGTGQSHEMKIIFRRLSALSQFLLHAYFVFDGPDCPQLKRGKDIPSLSAPRLLSQRFQELLTAFGFNWHVAPGEAEAELACLQSLGLIDAVATPYNDALLFGVTCIICSVPNIGRYEDVYIYTPDAIEKDASLEWGDLLLIVLMSSTDNDASGSWCSVEVAHRLAYYGFGRSLLEAAVSFPFVEFMDFVAKWRDDVCEVLRTDPQRLLGGKHHEIARIIKEEHTEFPDPTVLAMYLLPLTSWSDGHSPVTTTTSRQPDLHSLATFCLQCLSWSPSIVQSELMDALTGTAMRALLQLPGNTDSGQLRHGLRVMSYSDDGLLPTYKISLPTQLLTLPLDVDPSPDVHMSPLGEDSNCDSFYELEIPAVVLEYSRPDLVQDFSHLSSQSSCVGFEDEDAGGQSSDTVVNAAALSPAARVIDPSGSGHISAGVYDPMD
ncbi:PIN domain-like protein [Pisolithus microcarpus]|nr:PIN domain-like protein [Pisolithus microcarpus]